GGRGQIRLVRREPDRAVPGRAGRHAAWRAAGDEVAVRDAALPEGARNASPRSTDADAAHDRPGAAPDAADAGTHGAGAGPGAAVEHGTGAAAVQCRDAPVSPRPQAQQPARLV